SDFGIFALVDAKLADSLSLIGSARWDTYDATTTGTNNGPASTSSASDDAFTYNFSAVYNLPGGIAPYVTYAKSRYLELGQGGMIQRENVANGTWLQDSEITEAGVKAVLLGTKLYTTLAYYEQDKTAFDAIGGLFNVYESKGVEF